MKALAKSKRAPALVFSALLAACSGGTPVVPIGQASQAAGSPASGVKACHVSKTLSPNGGFIKLPTCFGFSGKMAYPHSSTNGTITARVTVSTSDIHPYQNPGHIIYYTAWVFTSTSPNDTTISFYDTVVNPHDGDRLSGPTVNPADNYSAFFEVPNTAHPIKKTTIGITVGGTTQGHTILGIPFVGTPVLAGVKNFVLFGTKT